MPKKFSFFSKGGEREEGGERVSIRVCKGVYFGKKHGFFWSILNWGERRKKCKFLFQKGKGAERGEGVGGQKNMHFSGQY